MARIKHIALAVENPAKTADFYKEVFGLQELRRTPPDSGANGVWLTDGYIYFAILRTGTGEVANTGEPSTTVGVHHIGFYVDDLDEARAAIERANATECPNSSAQNRKYADPDGIMIDMRARGWDEQIKARTQLFELTPVSND